MTNKKKAIAILLSGLAIVGLSLTAAIALPQSSQAAGTAPTSGTAVANFERSGPAGIGADQDALLADALGITAEELQTAQQTAHEAAIAKALEEGLITQAQADRLLQGNMPAGRLGFGGLLDLRNSDIDPQALLADALGISVETLQTAQETAFTAGLAQAVTDGVLTQEQADLMQARHDLQKYFAEQKVYENAVQQAVDAGVLTQAQADAILSSAPRGFGGMDFGGPGYGFRGGLADGRGGMMGRPGGGPGALGSQWPQGAPAQPAAPGAGA